MDERQVIVGIRASKRSVVIIAYDRNSEKVLKVSRVVINRRKPLLERVHELYTTLEHYLGRFNPEKVVIDDIPKIWNRNVKSTGYSVAFTIGALSSLARAWGSKVEFSKIKRAKMVVRSLARSTTIEAFKDPDERDAITLCLAALVEQPSSSARSSA